MKGTVKKMVNVGQEELTVPDIKADVMIYAYSYESYSGTGIAVWRRGKKWYYDSLGHCSCYDAWENIHSADNVPFTLPQIIKLLSDDYGGSSEAESVVKYLKRYYKG